MEKAKFVFIVAEMVGDTDNPPAPPKYPVSPAEHAMQPQHAIHFLRRGSQPVPAGGALLGGGSGAGILTTHNGNVLLCINSHILSCSDNKNGTFISLFLVIGSCCLEV